MNRSRGDDDQASPWAGNSRRRYESRNEGRPEARDQARSDGRYQGSFEQGRFEQGSYEARPQDRYGRGDDPGDQRRRRDRPGADADSRPWGERGVGGGGLGPEGRGPGGRGPKGNAPKGDGPGGNSPIPLNIGTVAVLAGVLVVGIGIGTGLSSTTQGNQGNIASSQQLDMAVPDPEFCRQWGASAFVMDVEVYTTMNPSSSFVTQPTLKPGCVIRRENWSVLEKEGAITPQQMRQCKQRMNTFAYIGSVKDKPIVRCVYQTDISENKFVTKGIADDAAGVTPEADQF